MRRKILLVLVFAFSVILFSGKLNANPEELVSINNGASIRTKTETSDQGIKFTARLNEKAKDKEHGFYLVFGETTVDELIEVINEGGSPMIINEKEVFKVAVPGITSDNEYSVVLTGTPEHGYLDGLSAIPYVKDGAVYHFSKAPLTRSIAEVAVGLQNTEHAHPVYDEIISCTSDTKRLVPDKEGNLRLISGIVETSPENLKKEFARDWNQKFGTNLNDFNAEEFYQEASKPLKAADEDTNKNVSETNLFKFFSEKPHNYKWKWLLEVLEEACLDNATLTSQLDAFKYGGAHPQGHNLNNAKNLSYSLANFFNCANEGEKENIDFKNEAHYECVSLKNRSVVINPRNYRGLYKGDEAIGVPMPMSSPKGYRFKHYEVDGDVVNPGDFYKPKKDNVVFRPKHEVINYNIRFFDGATEIGALKATYNIEVELPFAVPEKPGYLFLGWYDNSGLQGEPLTKLNKGNQGHLSFYSSWEKEEVEIPVDPNEEFTIAFELNNGNWPVSSATPGYTDRDKMITDFLTDFYNFVKPAGVSLNDFLHGPGKTSGFDGSYNETETFAKLYDKGVKGVDASTGKFINQPQYNKWVPLFDVMEEYTNIGVTGEGATQSFWGSTWTGERRIKEFIQKKNLWGAENDDLVATLTSKIPSELKGSIPGVSIDVPKKYTPSSDDIVLPNPEKSGDNFLGWYDNAHFGGTVITKIAKGSSGNKKFYAKWESMEVTEPDPDLKQYTVTFDSQGGNAIPSTKVTEGNKVSKPANPTKSGYSFVEWQLSGSAYNFNNEVRSNLNLVAVYKKDEVVDPSQEYSITFNINGGSWEKVGGRAGYTNRDVMITDFLTDFYNFVKPSGVLLKDFIHGAGKTSGFDGLYDSTDYFDHLYANNVKGIDASTNKFINQPEYNKWVPLFDLMDEYVKLNPEQTFWGSTYVGRLRIKAFIQNTKPAGQWNHIPIEDVTAISKRIPEALKKAIPGTPITPPAKYKPTDEVILPKPEKANDPFIGWYDNSNYQGNPISKIAKGSTGNKVFYARYNSTEVPLTEAEKMTAAKAALNIGFASGDSASSITKKITLSTTGLHGTSVTWVTSDASTINTAGNVVRKEGKDVPVKLTATIKLGSLTEVKEFNVIVKEFEPEPEFYTIDFVLNGGKFVIKGYTSKAALAKDVLTDFHSFVKASENLNTFMHGAGKTSGFNGTWYSNEDYRDKIFKANTKSGNNEFFLSHSSYQAKWKPFADFMSTFVKVGNPDQDFWASPYTGNMRMWQYFTDVKPGAAWSDEDMAKIPTGLAATVIPDKYNADSATISLLTPEKAGYDFVGWYTANTGGTKVTSIPKGSTGNKKFYARWEEVSSFTIKYNLNGGAFKGYTSKTTLARDFLTDLHSFVGASENVNTFMHGAGKTSGFNGTWYSNEDYRAKIFTKGVKSGNNSYFLSSSTYQSKWKPFADFMVTFVKVGNPDQDFWASPYTGNLRMKQYFTDVKPGAAWSDADMAKIPTGLAASVAYEYNVNSPAITLPTPTRSGHNFLGWYTANTGGTKVTSIPKGSTGNKTFYARWKEVSNPELIALMNLITGGHKSTLTKKAITYYGATNYTKTQYQLVNRYLFEPLSINKTRYWLSTSRSNHPNYTRTKHWVVIHDTANTNATAAANANYMVTQSSASWHYTTGNDGIFQSMNEDMVAWHAGDGTAYSVFHNTGISASNPYTRPRLGLSGGYFTINGTRTSVRAPSGAKTSQFAERGLWPVIINGKYHINDTQIRTRQRWGGAIGFDGGNINGIGIETSVLRTDHIWYTWAKTSKLVADILVRRGLLPDRIVYHNNFDGKQCPKTAILNGLLDEWEQMMFLEYKIRKSYSNYKIDFTSHSNILDSNGRVTALQSSTRNITYTVKLTAPNGVTMSKTFTTSVRS